MQTRAEQVFRWVARDPVNLCLPRCTLVARQLGATRSNIQTLARAGDLTGKGSATARWVPAYALKIVCDKMEKRIEAQAWSIMTRAQILCYLFNPL